MIKESITPKQLVNFLNQLLKIDPIAINNLFNTRVFCNKELADHPTVQVLRVVPQVFRVGIIGLLNGLFPTTKDKWGRISAIYEEDRIIKFDYLTDERIEEFVNEGRK